MEFLWMLILIVGVVYFSSMQGITCCNSGSLYALVRAIVEKKKLTIKEFAGYTNFMDYAKRGDKYYSDRPPGLAFVAIPFHALRLNVTLVSIFTGLGSAVLVYLLTFQLVNNELIAFFTGLIFAFCTINWRYSTTFIIHPLSTFLVLLSVYLFMNSYSLMLVGFILGLATMVEYTDALFLFGIGLTEIISSNYLSVFPLGIGYFIGMVPLLAYNWVCFGSPLTTSYKYSAHFKWSNKFSTTFVTPIYKGFFGLLFHIKKKSKIAIPGGVLVLSPVLVFGIIGFFYLDFNLLVLFLALTLPLFLVISKHKTYWAGGGGDHRYLSSIIPYLTILVGVFLENNFSLWPLVLLAAIVSLIFNMIKISALTVNPKELQGKNIFQITGIVFSGVFLRKIHLERYPPEVACAKLKNRL